MLSPILRLTALGLFLSLTALAADEPANGPRRVDPGWHALVGATVHVAPGDTREGAAVVVRDGKVVSVGGEVPDGARVWDLTGHHVYAAFIDAFVPVDAPRTPKEAKSAHWNRMVTWDRSPLDGKGLPEKTAKELRELGFGAALLAPKDGVVRGHASLVSLRKRDPAPGSPRPQVYEAHSYDVIAFDTVRGDAGGFPNAKMGAIALARQSLMDRPQGHSRPPLLMVAQDELDVLRAAKVVKEAREGGAIVGSGTEFRRLAAIAALKTPLVVPLAYPKKPDVGSIEAAEGVSLREMMTWEQAPTNARRLDSAGVTVALTTDRLKERSKFRDRLRKAIRHGLSEERALAMLTTSAAAVCEHSGSLGEIAPGAFANLQVTDGPVFAKNTRLRWLFIDGVPEEIRSASLAGRWELTTVPPVPDAVTLAFDHHDGMTVHSTGEKSEAKIEVLGDRVSFSFDHDPFGDPGHFVLSGFREGETMSGDGVRSDGRRFRWTAKRVSRDVEKKEWEKEEKKPEVPEKLPVPFGAYGTDGLPERHELIVLMGMTVWTCGPEGVIEDGFVVIRDGKIEYAGKPFMRDPMDALFIEVKGGHVTPGLIDCHSHTGISGGVNDSGQAVTAEVRIEDVTNPDDVNFYRQLAGGLTVLNALHGSANPIGGQSSTVKLRWGVAHTDEMHFEEAKPGIKFALGENVKQSNWDIPVRNRYPQTRMGVEMLIRDRFTAAREYAAAIKRGEKVRRDLELEALAEVLAGERLLHCHSYRQDEILMLCRLSEEFDFRIGTFQHVLEGYKVAEAIAARSLGGSCFSDWWAYKVEVQDAIPDNGPIMAEAGALVSYNSDSADLARRMNTEAAKAVKYGPMKPEEALKLVTINPAIQLGIEKRVGSLEKGKDGDFVIWSGPPLSGLSRCIRTFIDGREYWSVTKDEAHRERIRKERRRLIAKVLAAKDDGDWKDRKKDREYRCCDVDHGGAR
jgi:imidazolonepropionase-like amidohydrolase